MGEGAGLLWPQILGWGQEGAVEEEEALELQRMGEAGCFREEVEGGTPLTAPGNQPSAIWAWCAQWGGIGGVWQPQRLEWRWVGQGTG